MTATQTRTVTVSGEWLLNDEANPDAGYALTFTVPDDEAHWNGFREPRLTREQFQTLADHPFSEFGTCGFYVINGVPTFHEEGDLEMALTPDADGLYNVGLGLMWHEV